MLTSSLLKCSLFFYAQAINLPNTFSNFLPQNILSNQAPHSNENCPLNIPLTCSNSTPVYDTCCFEYPGGVMLQTQFWDYYPPIGPNDTFTLHGLWPDNCDGSYEQFCNSALNINNVSSVLDKFGEKELLEKMRKIWKNFNGDDEHLWIHEYNKHGTCMNTLNPSCYGSSYREDENVRDFFKVAVDLYDKLPTFEWLAEANIHPSEETTYTKKEIEDALSSQFGRDVFISCNKYHALQEVWYFYHLKGSVLSRQFYSIDSLSNSKCPETGIKFMPKKANPNFPTPTHKPGSPTGAPAVGKGFLKLSGLSGCIIGNGHWYTSGTCASFQLIKSQFGGYNLKSSKGFCGINAYGELACNNRIEAAQFQYGKESNIITYGGKQNWSTSKSFGKFKQNPISPGDDGDLVFQLKFASH